MHDVDAHANDEVRFEELLERANAYVTRRLVDALLYGDAYEPDDPKSDLYYERMVDVWDGREKCP